MMCLPAKIADTPLVWKDQTCLERSYSGRDSDTVNSTMEWGLKVYLLSNEEKDKHIKRKIRFTQTLQKSFFLSHAQTASQRLPEEQASSYQGHGLPGPRVIPGLQAPNSTGR